MCVFYRFHQNSFCCFYCYTVFFICFVIFLIYYSSFDVTLYSPVFLQFYHLKWIPASFNDKKLQTCSGLDSHFDEK